MKRKKPTNVINVVPTVKKPKKHGKNAAQRQLDADWEKMIAAHAAPLEKGARRRGISVVPNLQTVPKLTAPPGRQGAVIPSLVTPGHTAPLKEAPVYTGTKMKGVATMHKSNSAPVFSDDEAVDI